MTKLADFPITKRWPASNPDVIQLYSFPTPNGVKASIMLEETGLAYEPHKVTLSDVDVKSAEFLSLNPNNKDCRSAQTSRLHCCCSRTGPCERCCL